MSKSPSFALPTLFAMMLSSIAPVSPAWAANEHLIEPHELIIDHTLPQKQVHAQILAARRYGTFWDTGEPELAHVALAPNFIDRTLPPGREQGLPGPLAASKMVRAAVPDMRCEIEQMMVVDDRVIVHLRFRGHFTGEFKNVKGQGQAIDFIATDIYRVRDGRITDNWHIEDNLTFFQQLGLIQ